MDIIETLTFFHSFLLAQVYLLSTSFLYLEHLSLSLFLSIFFSITIAISNYFSHVFSFSVALCSLAFSLFQYLFVRLSFSFPSWRRYTYGRSKKDFSDVIYNFDRQDETSPCLRIGSHGRHLGDGKLHQHTTLKLVLVDKRDNYF